jgi:DNA recombination protein RmuC
MMNSQLASNTITQWIVISCFVLGVVLFGIGVGLLVTWLFRRYQSKHMQEQALYGLLNKLQDGRLEDQRLLSDLKDQFWQAFQNYRDSFDRHQLQGFALIQNNLQQNNNAMTKRLDQLTEATQTRLQNLGVYMEQRLSDGLVKTTETFGQIMERLSLIDAAQKQMSELSSNVINLQQILSDKRARGAFGEMQLNDLVQNMLPPQCFKFQHTFSNHKRVDCVLFLPPPTGTIAIDAKFPLENFRRALDKTLPENTRRVAQLQFRQDIRTHIKAVASKYIIPHETSDGVILFIPAETIFSEIHAHYGSIVKEAQQARVWLTSPSTLMAVLTTVKAVLKDAQTREQAHLIQKHLSDLKVDFMRFQQRMNKLAQHVGQAHQDIQEAQISATKITERFERVERVELTHEGDLIK